MKVVSPAAATTPPPPPLFKPVGLFPLHQESRNLISTKADSNTPRSCRQTRAATRTPFHLVLFNDAKFVYPEYSDIVHTLQVADTRLDTCVAYLYPLWNRNWSNTIKVTVTSAVLQLDILIIIIIIYMIFLNLRIKY